MANMVKKLQERDYYADNLAKVNQSNRVVTTENIYNEQGTLLLPSGTRVDKQTSNKIAQHKISQPLERCISLDKVVDASALVKHFKAMPSHPEVVELFNGQLDISVFEEAAENLSHYPLITQKLAVMADRLPLNYKKSVLGAFLCLLLCKELRLDKNTSHHVFIAALCQDVGLLHIDPAVVEIEGPLTTGQWQILQGHVVISYHFLKLVPNLPKIISQAVLEHHEQSDGLGYPRCKLETELCIEGQIVALADTTIALFYKYIFGLGYSFNALTPIMQINSGLHRHKISEALMRLCKKNLPPMKKRHSVQEMVNLISRIVERFPYIHNWFTVAKDFNLELAKKYKTKPLFRITQMINRIHSVLSSSGVGEESLLCWMKDLDSESLSDEDFMEIEILALMFSEVSLLLGDLLKNISLIVNGLNGTDKELEETRNKLKFLKELYLKVESPII